MLDIKNLYLGLILFAFSVSCKVQENTPKDPIEPVFETDGLVTFNGNIKAIMVKNCGPCHIAGGNRNNMYDTYAKSKLLFSFIIERVQLSEKDGAFMPRDGKKLSDLEIKLLKKWEKDGFLEK